MPLSDNEEFQLYDLIQASVAQRYEGALVRYEDPRAKYEDTYVPEDEAEIHDLLYVLWGEHITLDTLEHVQATLIEHGLERKCWPRAYCEEEEDAKAEDEARRRDYEEAGELERARGDQYELF